MVDPSRGYAPSARIFLMALRRATMRSLSRPSVQVLASEFSSRSHIDLPIVDVSSIVESFLGSKARGYDEACLQVLHALMDGMVYVWWHCCDHVDREI